MQPIFTEHPLCPGCTEGSGFALSQLDKRCSCGDHMQVKETEKTDSVVAGGECITAGKERDGMAGAVLNEGSKKGLAERVTLQQRPRGM